MFENVKFNLCSYIFYLLTLVLLLSALERTLSVLYQVLYKWNILSYKNILYLMVTTKDGLLIHNTK